jgi:methionyl-tRNA formyltransferase
VRTVFFGSPEFAVPTLRALAADANFEIALVVTQSGKGESPVEQSAKMLDLPLYKPGSLRGEAARAPLLAADPDLFVVAAFGLIFGPRVLAMPRLGSVNVHPSLLPRYRGASPIVAAIAAGDEVTGVSLMVMDTGIDTGAVVSIVEDCIQADDTAESLGRRLAEIGAAQARRDIPLWATGALSARPQLAAGASLTRPLSKSDGWIDWSLPAVIVERRVRAMWPWPRAWTTLDGQILQVHRASVASDAVERGEPGRVLVSKRRLIVATGDGALELLVVEPAGRRAMPAGAFLNGLRRPLHRLGVDGGPDAVAPLVIPVGRTEPGEGAK